VDFWTGPGTEPDAHERASLLAGVSQCALTTRDRVGRLRTRRALLERVSACGSRLTVRILDAGVDDDPPGSPRVTLTAVRHIGLSTFILVDGMILTGVIQRGDQSNVLRLDLRILRMECFGTPRAAGVRGAGSAARQRSRLGPRRVVVTGH
jgi:hypothetical protein